MRNKCFGINEKALICAKPPSLMNTWLQKQAIVQERLKSCLQAKKLDTGKPNEDSEKRGQKDRSSDVEAAVNDKKEQ